MIKEALRLKLQAGLSYEQTARALRISKGAVVKYVGLAAAAGLSHWEAVRDLDEHALQARLLGGEPRHAAVVKPDFARIHRELSRKGVTLTLLWQEYVAAHRAHREWTPSRLIDWGQRIGVSTAEVISRILSEHKHPEHGYHRCLGLLSLARRHGQQRLENACTVALRVGAFRHRIVKQILENNRDRLALPDEATQWRSPVHENVRGPGYYQ